jgi:hypothetical protein
VVERGAYLVVLADGLEPLLLSQTIGGTDFAAALQVFAAMYDQMIRTAAIAHGVSTIPDAPRVLAPAFCRAWAKRFRRCARKSLGVRVVRGAMSAKEKIRALTNAWYGFALFVGLANLVMNGIGIFTIAGAAIATVISIATTWFISRLLLRRSSITRVVLVVLSIVGAIGGVLAAGGCVVDVLRGAPLRQLVMAVIMIASVSMNVRSFRVLTDERVKAFF